MAKKNDPLAILSNPYGQTPESWEKWKKDTFDPYKRRQTSVLNRAERQAKENYSTFRSQARNQLTQAVQQLKSATETDALRRGLARSTIHGAIVGSETERMEKEIGKQTDAAKSAMDKTLAQVKAGRAGLAKNSQAVTGVDNAFKEYKAVNVTNVKAVADKKETNADIIGRLVALNAPDQVVKSLKNADAIAKATYGAQDVAGYNDVKKKVLGAYGLKDGQYDPNSIKDTLGNRLYWAGMNKTNNLVNSLKASFDVAAGIVSMKPQKVDAKAPTAPSTTAEPYFNAYAALEKSGLLMDDPDSKPGKPADKIIDNEKMYTYLVDEAKRKAELYGNKPKDDKDTEYYEKAQYIQVSEKEWNASGYHYDENDIDDVERRARGLPPKEFLDLYSISDEDQKNRLEGEMPTAVQNSRSVIDAIDIYNANLYAMYRDGKATPEALADLLAQHPEVAEINRMEQQRQAIIQAARDMGETINQDSETMTTLGGKYNIKTLEGAGFQAGAGLYNRQHTTRLMWEGVHKAGAITVLDDLETYIETGDERGVKEYIKNHPEISEYMSLLQYDSVDAFQKDMAGKAYQNASDKAGMLQVEFDKKKDRLLEEAIISRARILAKGGQFSEYWANVVKSHDLGFSLIQLNEYGEPLYGAKPGGEYGKTNHSIEDWTQAVDMSDEEVDAIRKQAGEQEVKAQIAVLNENLRIANEDRKVTQQEHSETLMENFAPVGFSPVGREKELTDAILSVAAIKREDGGTSPLYDNLINYLGQGYRIWQLNEEGVPIVEDKSILPEGFDEDVIARTITAWQQDFFGTSGYEMSEVDSAAVQASATNMTGFSRTVNDLKNGLLSKNKPPLMGKYQKDGSDPFLEASFIQANPSAYQAEIDDAINRLRADPDLTTSQKAILALLEKGVALENIFEGAPDVWFDKTKVNFSSIESQQNSMNVVKALGELGVIDQRVATAASIIEGTNWSNAIAQSQLTGDRIHDLKYNLMTEAFKMLPQIAVSLVGTPAAGLALGTAFTGLTSYGTYAEQARLDGANLDQQSLYGVLSAIVESGLNLIPTQRLLKIPEKVLTNALFEIGGEVGTTLITNTLAKVIYKPDMSLFSVERGKDAVFSIPEIIDTIFISGVLGGASNVAGIAFKGNPETSSNAITITQSDGTISLLTDSSGNTMIFGDHEAQKFLHAVDRGKPDGKLSMVDMSGSKGLEIAREANLASKLKESGQKAKQAISSISTEVDRITTLLQGKINDQMNTLNNFINQTSAFLNPNPQFVLADGPTFNTQSHSDTSNTTRSHNTTTTNTTTTNATFDLSINSNTGIVKGLQARNLETRLNDKLAASGRTVTPGDLYAVTVRRGKYQDGVPYHGQKIQPAGDGSVTHILEAFGVSAGGETINFKRVTDETLRTMENGAKAGENVAEVAGDGEESGEHNRSVSYSRPSKFRKGIKSATWLLAVVDSDGGVVKSPGGSIVQESDNWVMGHKPGYEFKKHKASAARRGITRKEFIDEHNNPAHYRPETKEDNESHIHEGSDDLNFWE